MPVILTHKDKSITTYALLDEGANVSLIDEGLCSQLGLVLNNKSSLILKGVNSVISTPSECIKVNVRGIENSNNFDINIRSLKELALALQTVNVKRLSTLTISNGLAMF